MFPQSRFGAIRKHDIHTGIDIYCNDGDSVWCVESGVLEKVEQFTGPEVNSPWWNTTYAVTIRTESHLMLYGEIIPMLGMEIGQYIEAGTLLGFVTPVLKVNKGLNPLSMLHFEMYSDQPVALVWNKGEPRPTNLIDPTEYLLKLTDKEISNGKDSNIR
jgi:hypothetical protein